MPSNTLPAWWESCYHAQLSHEHREEGVWCRDCNRFVSWTRPDGTICDVRSPAIILNDDTNPTCTARPPEIHAFQTERMNSP